MKFVNTTIHGFSEELRKDGTQNTLLGLLAASDENCCMQEVKATQAINNVTPQPTDIFGDDETLKEQEAAARIAKMQREKEEKERKEKERKEKEEREKKEKKAAAEKGPSWFEKTFSKISTQLFEDDKM